MDDDPTQYTAATTPEAAPGGLDTFAVEISAALESASVPGHASQAQSTHQKAPETASFHRFGNLPKELRSNIWRAAIPDFYMYRFRLPVLPDVGDNKVAHDLAQERELRITPMRETAHAMEQIRNLLAASWDAREEVLYCLPDTMELTYAPPSDPFREPGSIIHFNASKDIFCIVGLEVKQYRHGPRSGPERTMPFNGFNPLPFLNVKSLGIEIGECGESPLWGQGPSFAAGGDFVVDVPELLTWFPRLECLCVVESLLSCEPDSPEKTRWQVATEPGSLADLYNNWFAWTNWGPDLEMDPARMMRRCEASDADCGIAKWQVEVMLRMFRTLVSAHGNTPSYLLDRYLLVEMRTIRRMDAPHSRFPVHPSELHRFD